MELVYQTFTTKEKIKTVCLDIIALAVIYFVPAFAHNFQIPIYLAEPLRIILVLSVLHTRKENAYILALTLPLFSYLISGHPIFFKMLIVMFELTLNVWLFLDLSKRMNNIIFPMFLSIVVSKVFYYTFQFLFISLNLLNIDQIDHPIFPQVIVTLVFSIYAVLILRKKRLD